MYNNPDILILSLNKQIQEARELIESEEFPIIDIEAFLSIVFSCYTAPEIAEDSFRPTVRWLIENVIENRDIPNEVIKRLENNILKTMQDIYDALLMDNLLSEQFPYEFKQLLKTGGVVLSKIHYS